MATDKQPLRIAVVIPTRRREERLAFALEALAEQSLDAESYEVVVVRESGGPGPLASAPARLRLRQLEAPPGSGPATKRNLGWRATAAPLVAFTDDDCRADPGWLEALLATGGEDVFVQGRTEPEPDEAHLLLGFARSQRIDEPSAWFETCNIAYPRTVLDRLGGFDERFGLGGEDTDLGLRALEAGVGRSFERTALVWHAVLPRPLPAALRDVVERDSLPLVIARHPRQREAVYARYFLNREHALLLAAVAGLLVFRRRPGLAALATLPYLGRYLDTSRMGPKALARFAVHLPGRVAVDATEVAATVRGALRHRVFLL